MSEAALTTKDSLRANGTNVYAWRYASVVIDKDSLDQFELLTRKRDIRSGKVTGIRRLLEKGGHFESGFVVNLKGGKYRLIDGNHRLQAIKDFLAQYPDRRVKVALQVYDNLDEHTEREYYTLWNKGTAQTTNDFIQSYWDEISIFRIMKQPQFPVNIASKWSAHAMEVKQLLSPYLVKDAVSYHGAFAGGGEAFVKVAKTLTKDDVAVMKAMMDDYIAAFGQPDRNNPFYKPLLFYVVTDIWLHNYQNMQSSQIVNRLKKLYGNQQTVYWSSQGCNNQAARSARTSFLSVLNAGRSKNLLV